MRGSMAGRRSGAEVVRQLRAVEGTVLQRPESGTFLPRERRCANGLAPHGRVGQGRSWQTQRLILAAGPTNSSSSPCPWECCAWNGRRGALRILQHKAVARGTMPGVATSAATKWATLTPLFARYAAQKSSVHGYLGESRSKLACGSARSKTDKGAQPGRRWSSQWSGRCSLRLASLVVQIYHPCQ